MNTKILLGILSLVMISLLTVNMAIAAPLGRGLGNGIGCAGDLSEEELAKLESEKNAMVEAITNNDFESWKSLMEAQITQERFDNLVKKQTHGQNMQDLKEEMQQAWEDDDYERVKEIKAELEENKPEGCQNHESDKSERKGFGNGRENGTKRSFWHKMQFWKQ